MPINKPKSIANAQFNSQIRQKSLKGISYLEQAHNSEGMNSRPGMGGHNLYQNYTIDMNTRKSTGTNGGVQLRNALYHRRAIEAMEKGNTKRSSNDSPFK